MRRGDYLRNDEGFDPVLRRRLLVNMQRFMIFETAWNLLYIWMFIHSLTSSNLKGKYMAFLFQVLISFFGFLTWSIFNLYGFNKRHLHETMQLRAARSLALSFVMFANALCLICLY